MTLAILIAACESNALDNKMGPDVKVNGQVVQSIQISGSDEYYFYAFINDYCHNFIITVDTTITADANCISITTPEA